MSRVKETALSQRETASPDLALELLIPIVHGLMLVLLLLVEIQVGIPLSHI